MILFGFSGKIVLFGQQSFDLRFQIKNTWFSSSTKGKSAKIFIKAVYVHSKPAYHSQLTSFLKLTGQIIKNPTKSSMSSTPESAQPFLNFKSKTLKRSGLIFKLMNT